MGLPRGGVFPSGPRVEWPGLGAGEPRESKRLAQLTANLDEELSQIFTSLGAWDIFFMWPLLFGELPGVTG